MDPVVGRESVRQIPRWLKSDLPDAYALGRIARKVYSLGLNTICFEARCPNKAYCLGHGSVTFLILGRNCTRRCGFCNVTSAPPDDIDLGEPERISKACSQLGIDYVVITSVTRDDLPDGGSGHFARCVEVLKRNGKCRTVEVLTPDFGGDAQAVDAVVAAGADVYGHNIETVSRLYPIVRKGASYERSLAVLKHVRSEHPGIIVKSGLMLGLGETRQEVRAALKDLSDVGCDIVTLGQYMQPSKAHLAVRKYIEPTVFEEMERYACELGLVGVCGPRVRSSYLAKAAFCRARLRRQKCA
jgi:lipoic acid synthetase